MASRATQAAAVDTAYASLQIAIAAWIAAGGDADLFTRWLNAQVALIDPTLAAVITRRLGSSNLSGYPPTLAAADVKP